MVEIGAGLAVPTIRHIAERAAARHKSASLVRVNLDDTGISREVGPERTTVLPMGALAALTEIESVLQEDQ